LQKLHILPIHSTTFILFAGFPTKHKTHKSIYIILIP